MEHKQKVGLNISVRTFIGAVALLLILMLAAGILTQVVPQGSFQRVVVDGREQVVAGSYAQLSGAAKLPVWRWLTAPFEVLLSGDSTIAIGIMVFLTLIGGTFYILDKSGVLRYIMSSVIKRYASQKYRMLAVMIFIFMLLGSTVGIFEETITLVPIAVAIAFSMGWDSLVGLGISAFAVAMGFGAGTFNPFTVGVAQNLAEVPMFSGVWLRAAIFALSYVVLVLFISRYARRIEADPARSITRKTDELYRDRYASGVDESALSNTHLRLATRIFVAFILVVFAYIVLGFFIKPLADYTLIVMAVMFAAAGLVCGAIAQYGKTLGRDFLKGMLSVLPAVLLILLAMSVKQIISAGGIMDTILYSLSGSLAGASSYGAALLIFLIVLVFNGFIGSGSAKAFLLIPLIAPLADLSGVTRQTMILAFVLGDGFSNMIYPTNAALLIMLGLTGTSWGKWFRWTWKMQLIMLIMSVAALCLAVGIGY
ncbi:MAG: hypothetical protein RR232_06910 [Clostridia bacterium]